MRLAAILLVALFSTGCATPVGEGLKNYGWSVLEAAQGPGTRAHWERSYYRTYAPLHRKTYGRTFGNACCCGY